MAQVGIYGIFSENTNISTQGIRADWHGFMTMEGLRRVVLSWTPILQDGIPFPPIFHDVQIEESHKGGRCWLTCCISPSFMLEIKRQLKWTEKDLAARTENYFRGYMALNVRVEVAVLMQEGRPARGGNVGMVPYCMGWSTYEDEA